MKPECLVASPAAKWWKAWEAGGGRREDLVVFIENRADYDGLAGSDAAECARELFHMSVVIFRE